MIKYIVCIISFLLILVNSKLGVDLSTLTSVDSFACLLKQNHQFLVVRAYRSYAAPDPNAPQTIANAIAAGIKQIDVYMFPCFNKDKPAKNQVSQMIQALKNSKYNRVWLDMETNTSPNCGWSKDTDANCAFTQQLVQAVQSHGKPVGIYASKYMWTQIMGGLDKCMKFGTLPLWYAHYDHNPSFVDWSNFGGWTKPFAKQYQGTTSLCNAGVDLNFMA